MLLVGVAAWLPAIPFGECEKWGLSRPAYALAMASGELSRRADKVVGLPPLVEMTITAPGVP
jgi:hypothetical protein